MQPYCRPGSVCSAFARSQQLARTEEVSPGVLQSKGACFLSPSPNTYCNLNASSFDDDGVEYKLYTKQSDEVSALLVSAMPATYTTIRYYTITIGTCYLFHR